MKMIKVLTLATNGNGKKPKKATNGPTKTSVDVAPSESFNSRELLRVLTEVKNGNFTVRMPIDEVGLSGKINDTLNQMITNLHETTLRNQDQDWLKSNLAKFAVMLQGQKDLSTVTKRILSELAQVVTAHYGAFYILKTDEATQTVKLKLYSTYAYNDEMNIPKEFSIGEGLVGQCALEMQRILIANVPKGYIKISSALGRAKPSHLILLPVLFEKKVKAVIELASLDSFSENHLDFLGHLTESIGIVLNTIEASTRTEGLLEQSQSQASELKTQQEELRITNDELQVKALLLVKQKEEVEGKNRELGFQNDEREKRAAELSIANTELAFQNDEKEKRAAELSVANKELAFQNDEKEKRAAELSIANIELAFQNDEKEKRAAELSIANKELAFQNDEKEKRAAELVIANYARSLIEASLDPLVTISAEGKILDVNEASVKVTGVARENLIGTDFSNYFTEPKKAQEGYLQVFEKGFVSDYSLTVKHKNGKLTDVLYNASVYKDENGNVLGVFAAARDVTEQKWAIDLRIANKELAFQNNEKEKRAAELSIANKELLFQNDEKEKRAAELTVANKEVEESRRSLEKKAEQLTLTSKYKSEFLANMSHELRTPLNSLLILAQQLYENSEGNLSDKQIRYAKTIHSCGDDLTQLINNILDLSKIESGFISVNISIVRIAEVASFVETTFRPISEARKLKFRIEMDNALSASIETDVQRLNQILKNLLSNAFKFTEKGEVVLKIKEVKRDRKSGHSNLDNARRMVSFSISDTGIGIPGEKQLIIFEAFQQAEGATSRKYGGTGLGLSISRGLADLLGGTIELESQVGVGSTFTLFLPLEKLPEIASLEAPEGRMVIQQLQIDRENVRNNFLIPHRITNDGMEAGNVVVVNETLNETGDDRSNVHPNDKVILVVEDDLRFGMIMLEKAHEKGLKAIVATNYMEVFDFIDQFTPIAITLDVNLPETSGWKIIHLMSHDLKYRHIPIHVISGEESRVKALQSGARSFLLKPLQNGLLNELFNDIISNNQQETRSILIVEDNEIDSSLIAKTLQNDKIKITIAETCGRALELIDKEEYDCIILDYTLPDMAGYDVILEVSKAKKIFTPVIIYSVRDFSRIELNNVKYNSSSYVMKGVNSIDDLFAETVSHLHINHNDLAPEKQKIIENIRNIKDVLTGRNILVVDDDVRNLFAMTSVFERFNMTISTAESGKEAISILHENPKIEMVLMDIMMPEMDGYETTRKIRSEHRNRTLPIIAVTAKAMGGDRQKCLEAGASDYITKPVKIDQLLSLMRLWICKQ